MLLRWTAVWHNFDLRSGHRSLDPRFDLVQRFHGEKAVIPREVEGPGRIASRFRHGIESLASRTLSAALQPRLRSAPLGMTKRESSLDHWRLKHAGIRCWLQIMFAKLRHGEFAWLIWLEKIGLIC